MNAPYTKDCCTCPNCNRASPIGGGLETCPQLCAGNGITSRYAKECMASCVEINQRVRFPEKDRVDLREPSSHRADAFTATTSRRWRGAAEI